MILLYVSRKAEDNPIYDTAIGRDGSLNSHVTSYQEQIRSMVESLQWEWKYGGLYWTGGENGCAQFYKTWQTEWIFSFTKDE